MADGYELDKDSFRRHLDNIYSSWKAGSGWNDAKAVVICVGKSQDEGYFKSGSLQLYLFQIEFTDVVMAFLGDTLHILASQKKCDLFKPLAEDQENSPIKVNFITRTRGDDQANFSKIMQLLNDSGSNVGVLKKEQPTGAFASAWGSVLEASGLTQVDVAPGLALAMAAKDEKELGMVRTAASVTARAMKRGFIDAMESIIDEEKEVSHKKLSDQVAKMVESGEKLKLKGVNADLLETCYPPIIQSGGVYDLKPSAQSTGRPLSADVIVASMGARYSNYCSNITRTFFVDPVQRVKAAYELLVEAQQQLTMQLQAGASVRKVVEDVTQFVRKKDPSLAPLLTKNMGFATGIEFRESALVLSGKSQRTLQEGMVLNACLGFHNIPLSKEDRAGGSGGVTKLEQVSMMIADTVVVRTKDAAEVLTNVTKEFRKVEYTLAEDEDEEESDEDEAGGGGGEKRKREEEEGGPKRSVRQKETRSRDNGGRSAEEMMSAEAKREKHQMELIRRRAEQAEREMASGGGKSDVDKGEEDAKRAKEVLAYKSPSEMPREAKPTQIYVDMEKEAVVLPINGVPVPFHIHTIKNVGQPQHEGRAHYFRVNFHYPTKSLPRDVAPAMAAVLNQEGQKMFIKELTFRSLDARNVTQQFRSLQLLRKRVRERETKKAEESNLVVQAKLVRTVDRRVPRLSDLAMRPVISGRKCVGTLEAHSNGLRYTSTKGEHLDVLYGNIKHALYQPCEKELVVLIHLHLRNHIMVGKKKHKDVQFYTEVMEASQALDGRRRSMYDPDELDEENRERQLRHRLNAAFKDFCAKVEATAERSGATLSFDIPYRELGFYGTPFKEMVFIQPSVNCLVNLTELPVFCVALDSVEHVHFERVMFGGKNFDLVVVFKDFDVLPVRVSAIEMKFLEPIKEWLDDIDIVFTAGPAGLNWKEVMKSVKEDERFYLATEEDGTPKPAGWEFLKMDNSGSEGEEEMSQESVFEPEESEEVSEEDSEDDDSESLVDEDESEDMSDASEGESEEEGLSWDEMEKQAAKQDKARGSYEEYADDAAPQKKRGGGRR